MKARVKESVNIEPLPCNIFSKKEMEEYAMNEVKSNSTAICNIILQEAGIEDYDVENITIEEIRELIKIIKNNTY